MMSPQREMTIKRHIPILLFAVEIFVIELGLHAT